MADSGISLIAAMDEGRVIGRDGQLPWRLPADLAHFKRLTLGKIVLMGRKTWDSLGRPLPGRRNWVLTRDTAFSAEGVEVFHSLHEALAAPRAGAELMVIGGANLYRQTLPLAQRLYLTEVAARVDGDAHFPEVSAQDFVEVSAEAHAADERHAYAYRFVTLERRGPLAGTA